MIECEYSAESGDECKGQLEGLRRSASTLVVESAILAR